jgi:hypothetical protein
MTHCDVERSVVGAAKIVQEPDQVTILVVLRGTYVSNIIPACPERLYLLHLLLGELLKFLGHYGGQCAR